VDGWRGSCETCRDTRRPSSSNHVGRGRLVWSGAERSSVYKSRSNCQFHGGARGYGSLSSVLVAARQQEWYSIDASGQVACTMYRIAHPEVVDSLKSSQHSTPYKEPITIQSVQLGFVLIDRTSVLANCLQQWKCKHRRADTR